MRKDSWFIRVGILLGATGLLTFATSDNSCKALSATASQQSIIDNDVFIQDSDEEDIDIHSAIAASIAEATATPTATPASEQTESVDVTDQQTVPEVAAEGQTDSSVSKQFEDLAISIAKDYVYVRKSASTDSKALGKLYRGSAGTILSVKGEWIKLSSGDIEGYVKREYLATGGNAEKLADKYGTKYAFLKTGTITLNVRQEKNTSSGIVAQLPEGKKYEVKSEDDAWCKIKVDGEIGYVSKEYINTRYRFETAESTKTKITQKVTSYSSGSTASSLISYAKQFIGNRYVWGGTSLTNGTDCSGFTLRVFQKFGYSLPRTSAEQANVGRLVSLSNVEPGDLIFYKRNGRVHHVAVYIGGGQIVHAAGRKWGIITSSMNYSSPSHARRILN